MSIFVCPQCKGDLKLDTDFKYLCSKCRKSYESHGGYLDFLGDEDFYAGEISQKEMNLLLSNIDTLGYNTALGRLFEENPHLQSYILDTRRADWVSHCLGGSNVNCRCLDIGSGLGNVSEILSHIYQEVYSLEAVKERVEFQKRKFQNSKISNIVLTRGNALKLPYADDCFDLVVCNGVLEWIGTLNKSLSPRHAQLSFLQELKRVISDKGCVYIGIENRYGLQFLLGARDHSGLPFTSLMPRGLASILVRRFGPSGGIYGDKSGSLKEKSGYYTYTYGLKGYGTLLNEIGFKFKAYWVFPSYVDPMYSGKMEDKIAIRGFLRYLKSTNRFRPGFKIPLSLLEKSNGFILSFLTSLLAPCFLFYCYKKEVPESFEDQVCNNSSLKGSTVVGGDRDMTYVLYDAKARPAKIVRLKRNSHEPIGSDIEIFDKTIPGFNPSQRAWMEDWIDGRTINPTDFSESNRAIKWLIDFQTRTRSTPMTDADIHAEIKRTMDGLMQVSSLNVSEYEGWLRDYESFLLAQKPCKTAEHGDFYQSNILFTPRTKKITVIDWNYYRKEGDPYFDFILFIICSMLWGAKVDSLVIEFKRNLDGHGRFTKVFSRLQPVINEHFSASLNMDVMIRYTLLRYIIRKNNEWGQNQKVVAQFWNLVDELSSSSSTTTTSPS